MKKTILCISSQMPHGHYVALIILLVISLQACGQEKIELTIAEYNCENLFDCRHDSLKNDFDFLPDGVYHWSKSRYWKKLNAIARAILSTATMQMEDDSKTGINTIPNIISLDLIGLCEVENDSVLLGLTQRSLLRGARYEYLTTDSPDSRGIDVALLYSPFAFRPLDSYSIRVDTIKGMRRTRDILYVKGLMNNGDSLHVFVVHAPSRRGGEQLSSRFRVHVAERLCVSVDSIAGRENNPKIVVMGDFNDYGNVLSLRVIGSHGLHDISCVNGNGWGKNNVRGTYKYQGEWSSLDHIFVSEALLRFLVDFRIVDDPMLLEDDMKYGGVKPRRFMLFNRLNDGFSDHLPIRAVFRF